MVRGAQSGREAARHLLRRSGSHRGCKALGGLVGLGSACLCVFVRLKERSWSTPATVTRILTSSGEDVELQGTHEAKASLASLKLKSVCIGARAQDRGPKPADDPPRLCSQVASASPGPVRRRLSDRTTVDPCVLTQAGVTGQVVNVSVVTSVSPASSPGGGLLRRTVDMRHGDYVISVNFLGSMSEQVPHGKIIVAY